jgi:anti-anti-sigma factor
MTPSREPTGAARLRQTPSGAVVEVDGPIDCATAPIVRALLDRGATDGQRVDLDLSQVPFIAAAGLSMLVTCGFDVRLLRPSPLTVRVLELCGLDQRFEVVVDDL